MDITLTVPPSPYPFLFDLTNQMMTSVTKESVLTSMRSSLVGNFKYILETYAVGVGILTPPVLEVSHTDRGDGGLGEGGASMPPHHAIAT